MALLAVAAYLLAPTLAFPADKIRVAKGGLSLMFTAIEIGQAAKIWDSYGLKFSLFRQTGRRRWTRP